ncbi:MAG: methionine aminotransferase [Candidatus Krumholzibacteriia bacterium]
MISRRLQPFGTTIFSEMTRLAGEHGAINLSQGFPDFDGPPEILAAASAAIAGGENQYARSLGHPRLVRAVASSLARRRGLVYDPEREVAVTCGATEGIAAAMLGLLEPGDEVLVCEPVYDSYPAAAALAGARTVAITLRFPDFALDVDAVARAVTPRTRMLLLNSPHNPTGKVFTADELAALAAICRRHDLLVLADEVYELLTYDGREHRSIAALDGMRERTLRLSSAGKSFSCTGWKIGWAVGPAPLVAALQAAHQFLTFCAAAPLQVAVAHALETLDDRYERGLQAEYAARRDFLAQVLAEVGFTVAPCQGTYFLLADFTKLWAGDDLSFARHLVESRGVAAIPPSVFYLAARDEGRRLLRFAFCKQLATLEAAAGRLRGTDDRPRP